MSQVPAVLCPDQIGDDAVCTEEPNNDLNANYCYSSQVTAGPDWVCPGGTLGVGGQGPYCPGSIAAGNYETGPYAHALWKRSSHVLLHEQVEILTSLAVAVIDKME